MGVPTLLATWGRRAPARWQRAVARVHRSYRVIWNPILARWAIVKEGPPDAMLEFGGYGYPGWLYIYTVETETGAFRPLDDSLLRELRDRTYSAQCSPDRHKRLIEFRKRTRDALKRRREANDLADRETAELAVRELFEPAIADRHTFGPSTRYHAGGPGSHQHPYGVV